MTAPEVYWSSETWPRHVSCDTCGRVDFAYSARHLGSMQKLGHILLTVEGRPLHPMRKCSGSMGVHATSLAVATEANGPCDKCGSWDCDGECEAK